MCPALHGRYGEQATDVVAACPMDSAQGLNTLLETITLSALMRTESDSGSSGNLSKEALLCPLMSLEFSPQDTKDSLVWLSPNSKSCFGALLWDIYNSPRVGQSHVVFPVLVPTFSAPNQTLDIRAVPEVEDSLKVFSEIRMDNIVSQATLRDCMKDHTEKVTRQLQRANGKLLSALNVHISMKQENAQDLVDYLRFQLEWYAQELVGVLHTKAPAVHVLALVVHGIRGCCDPHRSIRPFLLAGPLMPQPLSRGAAEAAEVQLQEWTGVAVDHFSHILPWEMPSTELLHGNIKQIFGLEQEGGMERFRFILADALPHVVPGFGLEQNADAWIW